MGLCKCPKKKITQHFCFEHKVNVCEFCMISDHTKCVVGPYLKWLEDDSYEKLCTLCHRDFSADECVRLLCYHVLHWNCLNSYASQMPANTAPAGYTCPDCHKPIFPPSSYGNTPVSLQLKKFLSTTEWARVGLGLPIADPVSNKLGDQETNVQNHMKNVPQLVHNSPAPSTNIPISVNTVTNFISSNSDANFGLSASSRSKTHDGDVNVTNPKVHLLDVDEDKYRRKSPFEFLARWFRSRGAFQNRRHALLSGNARWIALGVLVFIGVCTFIHYFLELGRISADHDPLLDPNYNPNIRVEGF